MIEALIARVKNSLKKQFYCMNDSWLADCVEYYLEDHENPTDNEIITFVINQWVLCDLREINNENGCLPKNLAQQKSMVLPGKYILQMDKMYDISTSKYKQLEKIRNVSSENVEATENENAMQEDKFQAWEPKSKRMLQLFLTDGIQDVLAIEYRPIKFLKDNLYPGFKLMIKGPVTCRRGVILLEEINIAEIGGEVDSLLIVNAVENVFARALNLEENPDPYNDNNKQTQTTQDTKKTIQIEDDFDIDSEAIDQIEKQIEQKVSINTQNSNQSVTRNQSNNNASNFQEEKTFTSYKNQNLVTSVGKNQHINSGNSLSASSSTKFQQNYNIKNNLTSFEDDDDSFMGMIDEKALQNLPTSKPTIQSKTIASKQSSSSSSVENQNICDFPTDDEIYDIDESYSPYFQSSKQQNKLSKNNMKSSVSSTSEINSWKTSIKTEKSEQKDSTFKSNLNDKLNIDSNKKHTAWKLPSPPKPVVKIKTSISDSSDIPDDDFDMSDFDLKTANIIGEFSTDEKSKISSSKCSQTSSSNSSKLQNLPSNVKTEVPCYQFSNNSTGSSNKTKSDESNPLDGLGKEFDLEFESEIDSIVSKKQQRVQNNLKSKAEKNKEISTSTSRKDTSTSIESTGIKRLASTISPCKDAIRSPQKVRCVPNTPTDKIKNRKITDFLNKPQTSSVQSPKPTKPVKLTTLLHENLPKIYEFICLVLDTPIPDEGLHTVVRGKVINIVKLNLLKNESGPYFHLEGTITDGSAKLDIVFSSEVLEKIIGYSPQEFSKKRKQSKAEPRIKDQLREDLQKAQQVLRFMDVFMEIHLKKGEKAIVLKTMDLTNEQKNVFNRRLQIFKN